MVGDDHALAGRESPITPGPTLDDLAHHLVAEDGRRDAAPPRNLEMSEPQSPQPRTRSRSSPGPDRGLGPVAQLDRCPAPT